MILGQVSWLDCFVFLFFLTPQLIIHVGFFNTLVCGLGALPFLGPVTAWILILQSLVIKLPAGFVYERFILSHNSRSPFVQQATYFEEIAIRCVRYAFAQIPANIGRTFFSKAVALPFLRFRMLRYGCIVSPIRWKEVHQGKLHGLWIISDESRKPDIIIYYAHGGGEAFRWDRVTSTSSFSSLEYTLVGSSPSDANYPAQLYQAIAGYKRIISIANNASKICVSGDSAGVTLILSLLLYLAKKETIPTEFQYNQPKMLPGMAVLISPWTTLISLLHKNTASDYLDSAILDLYAYQYAGQTSITDPLVSPGNCTSASWWHNASPSNGFFVTYGSEEVLAHEVRNLVNFLRKSDLQVTVKEAEGGIHACPVAALFLSSTTRQRQKGLKMIVDGIWNRMTMVA